MSGYVYFLGCAGRIKIGHSTDVARRVRGLATGSAHDLEVLCVIEGSTGLERAVHRHLKANRIRGEWFDDCSAVRDLMADLLNCGGVAISYSEPAGIERHGPTVVPDPFSSPLRPAIERVNACIDNYVRSAPSAARRRVLLPKIRRASAGLERIFGIVTSAALDGDPIDQTIFIKQATLIADTLERGLA